MDVPIIRDAVRWTDSLLKYVGVKGVPPGLPPLPPPPPPPVKSTDLALTKNLVRSAGLSGTLAICLGVYGAHAMKDDTPEELKRLFQMAQNYHLLHSVALLSLPNVSRPVLTGTLFFSGLTLFCGPLYYHAIKGDARFRRITPYGGLLLLAGWISILVF